MSAELRRAVKLDALRLLNAIACAHPHMVLSLLEANDLAPALGESLLITADARTRRQACIFLWDLCSVTPKAILPVLAMIEGLMPAAVAHATHGAQYWDLWERLLSSHAGVDGEHACADALLATVISHVTSASLSDRSRPRPAVGAAAPIEPDVIMGPLKLLRTQVRTSRRCADRLADTLPMLYSTCLVPTGLRQPPASVRTATAALLSAAAASSAACISALLPHFNAAHERCASASAATSPRGGNWGVDPAEGTRRQFVGLVNQGATCYMNALLQQLVMVPAFRDGLISAAPPVTQRSAIFDQLQSTFAHLRDGLAPCYDPRALVEACEALPMTFSARQQNDAAEFLMLLTEHLEERLKSTRQASLLRTCFGGKLVQQIAWEEAPAQPGGSPARRVSEREEAFLQIELPVKGHSSIEDALRAMVAGERLEGDNAYQLESGVKVDATKRICLGDLPATLIIQLKRFELDYESMTNRKLNSECAFPELLFLEPFTRRGLECAARGMPLPATAPYELVGVLVHSGTSTSGHYFSYVRPRDGTAAGRWYELNDDVVTRFNEARIPEECFGGVRDTVALPASGRPNNAASSASSATAATAAATAAAIAETSERTQNAFMLFYRRPESLHRRTGSAPPMATRCEWGTGRDATPSLGRAGAAACAGLADSDGGVSPSGRMVTMATLSASSPASETATGTDATAAAAAAATAVVASNEALLLRQHLLSPSYIGLVKDLLLLATPDGSSDFQMSDALPTPPPPLQGSRICVEAPWILPAPFSSQLPFQIVQMSAGFFFGHLLRTSDELLAPHLDGYEAWPRALARACGAHMPAAVWLLHELLRPQLAEGQHRDARHSRPAASGDADLAEGSSSAMDAPMPAPCWLLDALFLCASTNARAAVASLCQSLFLTVFAAEARAQRHGAAGGSYGTANTSYGHTTSFLSALLIRGVERVAADWKQAAPLWNFLLGAMRADFRRGQGLRSEDAAPCVATEGAAGDAFLAPTAPIAGAAVMGETNAAVTIRLLCSRMGALVILPSFVIGACSSVRGANAGWCDEIVESATEVLEVVRRLKLLMPGWKDTVEEGHAPSATVTDASSAPGEVALATAGAEMPCAMARSRSMGCLDASTLGTSDSPEGSAALLEAIALIVEAHHPPPPIVAAAPPPMSGGLPSPPLSPRRAAYGPPVTPITDADAAFLTCTPFIRAAAAMCTATAVSSSSLGLASTSPPTSSNVWTELPCDGGDVQPHLESLYRILRPLCATSVKLSRSILTALVDGMRNEPGESAVAAHANLLLRLLRMEDRSIVERCTTALSRPNGLLALLLELTGSPVSSEPPTDSMSCGIAVTAATTPSDATGAIVATAVPVVATGAAPVATAIASTVGASESALEGSATAPPISDASRCFLCLRLVLELQSSSEAAAAWLVSTLSLPEIDQLLRWLKGAGASQAIAPTSDGIRGVGGRLLSFSRRRTVTIGAAERVGTQRGALDALRSLRKRIEKAANAKTR
mmetsp:Transcript_19646/g.59545  ORF Transcript_19646/g.59545 Transcript_19646/m.59545 type:complete len:1499 (+) Transcript_19646:3-4499(+)